jgi:amino acid permease
MRKLAELKIFSYLLFAAVLSFIALTSLDLYDTSDYENQRPDSEELLAIKPGFGLITSMSIFSTAFFYHVMVFPAYSSLENRSTARFACSTMLTNSICSFVYITLGVISLFLFGAEVQPDIIKNMATRSGYASITLRLMFCLLLLVHIPFIFHALKESVLVVYEELFHRSVSSVLDEKIRVARAKRSADKPIDNKDA